MIGGGGIGNPGPDWRIMGSGDYNSDGKADILWQNASGDVADLGNERHQRDRSRQPRQPRPHLAHVTRAGNPGRGDCRRRRSI